MPISLGELATRFGCDLDGDPDIEVRMVASLLDASPVSISFLTNSAWKDRLFSTKAAAVVLRASDAADCPVASLISDDPYANYARMAALLHPSPAPVPGVHASAVIDASATVAPSAQIEAQVFIGERAIIGENAYVGPGCVVGSDCSIGDDTRLHANVTILRQVSIGMRCIFHPGAVVGADGFGNAMTPDGWVKVPQLGGVRIGNDVEIGANTTIDCGTLGDTIVEDGVRIDNLCQIGHNALIGAHTAMAGSTSIAGSSIIGKRCMFAGHSGAVGHVSICDNVIVSAQGMITKDITEAGVYASSFPAEKVQEWNRKVARFRRIGVLIERVSKLEKGD